MNKIKLGIIGFGRMGITHFAIINGHPEIEITAIADSSSMILSILKKYKKNLNLYEDYKELFQKEPLDAILICTPPAMHYEIALLAAEKQIHVFCEKPFTTNFSQAKELAEIFEQKGIVNQVGYVNRFNDVFKTVKKDVESGLIGKVLKFKSEMYSRTITKSEEGKTWRDSKESGGGAVYEMASHSIDLVNFLIGKPDKATGTILTKIYSANVEDAVCTNFLYKDGKSGSLHVNWSDVSYRKPTNKIEIFGTEGKILADQHSIKVFLKTENKEKGFREGWNTLYITDIFEPVPFYVRGNEFTSQLYHFVDCINNNKVNKCSFRDGANTLQIIEQMFKDYESNSKF